MKYADKKHSLFRYFILNTLITKLCILHFAFLLHFRYASVPEGPSDELLIINYKIRIILLHILLISQAIGTDMAKVRRKVGQ